LFAAAFTCLQQLFFVCINFGFIQGDIDLFAAVPYGPPYDQDITKISN
jgi:hypothetical protein